MGKIFNQYAKDLHKCECKGAFFDTGKISDIFTGLIVISPSSQ